MRDRRQLALLALAHAVTDSYGSSFLAPLLPLLAARLGLSLAMVGSLPTVMGLSGSLGQPVLGYLSDRWPRLCLVAMGPALAGIGCGLVGHMPSYSSLLACLFFTGLGIGAFHPQGALLAKRASGSGSLAMSAFTVGGSVGFGLAPLAAALALRTLGLGRIYWISLPGLLIAALVWAAISRGQPRGAAVSGVPGAPTTAPLRVEGGLAPTFASGARSHRPPPCSQVPRPHRALAFLTATVAVRAAVQVGITVFLPFYLVTSGLPGVDRETAKGLAVSVFLLANAFAGPVGGHLADRLGPQRVQLWSFLLATPPLLLAFRLPGVLSLTSLSLGGFLLALPQPANVILAQELMPQRAGIAASLITGLAWGIAMLLALPLGAAADRLGVGLVLHGLAVLPLLGAPLVIAMGPVDEMHRANPSDPSDLSEASDPSDTAALIGEGAIA